MARVEPVLGQLKKHPDTRHVPVVMIGDAAARIDALRAGAAVFLEEPVDDVALKLTLVELERMGDVPHRRIALIEEPDERLEEETVELLGGADNVALGARRRRSGRSPRAIPTISPSWWSGARRAHDRAVAQGDRRRGPARAADDRLPAVQAAEHRPRQDRRAAKTAVMAVADSPERLVDRAAVFLHRVEAQLPTPTGG